MADQTILSHGREGRAPGGLPADAVVLVCPDAFKGSLTVSEAAAAMAEGVLRALPAARVRVLPIADGGDGSVDALVRAGFTPHGFRSHGPTGSGANGLLATSGDLAVVEVANSCGLALLPQDGLDPLGSSTRGLGDGVRAALDLGVATVVLCLGGSASSDGGAGLLVALGAVLQDRHGIPLEPSGAALHRVARLDLKGLDPRIASTSFVVATDVTSPLLGPTGACAVFAPQKGADPATVRHLEQGMVHWAGLLAEATGVDASGEPGAGAAGGAGAAAISALSAVPTSGAAFVLEAVGLPAELRRADLLVTGEGRLDEQSLLGKGTVRVAQAARGAGVPVVAVCGSIALDTPALAALGIVAHAALAERGDPTAAMAHATTWLADATADALSRVP